MGIIAFSAFILPWALVALWLFRLPSALRADLPPTPWRPRTDYRAPGDAPGRGAGPGAPLHSPAVAPRTTPTGEPVH